MIIEYKTNENQKYPKTKLFRFTKEQAEMLNYLKEQDVNVTSMVRTFIEEVHEEVKKQHEK